MEWKIALAEPAIDEEEIRAVEAVLRSKWLTMGPITKEFERQFAEKMCVKHAFAVTNATTALHLANVALDISKGDEVICPGLTFVASANASRYAGADVIFADVISPADLTVDPADIERKITKRTKAITVVHYAGFPCLMERIVGIAEERGIKIIEDCAHAPFAWMRRGAASKQYVGAIGDVGCFSFFGNKNMTTGEGGMITTNDDRLAEKIRLLRSHGMTTLSYDRFKGHASTYDVVELGYNYRIDDIRSAIGLCQLRKIDDLNAKRRQVYQWYIDAFRENKNIVVSFAHRDLHESACHIMSVTARNDIDGIKNRLRIAGIQTSKHYELVSNFEIYRKGGPSKISFDTSRLITLPLSHALTRKDVNLIAEVVRG